jgi:Ca-activated chloride channel family protein
MMKFGIIFIFIVGLTLVKTVNAQFYIRGEVLNEKSEGLQNVKIIVHSTGLLYNSGSEGSFGILGANQTDSLSFYLEGYETFHIRVNTSNYVKVNLKMKAFTASLQHHALVSIAGDLDKGLNQKRTVGEETYSASLENRFISTQIYPSTSFVPNGNRASYSNIRRFINTNSIIPTDGVRIEEMLNYFNFTIKTPQPDSIFGLQNTLTNCPWTPENQLFFVQLNAKKVDLEKVPPSNLVFLIDVSGSMDMPNRLPLLKSSFQKLVQNLRAIDTLSIVVYGGVVGVMLPPISGAEKTKILEAIEALTPEGNTPGEAGITQAYRLARNQFIKGGNNRIILATDGDFNVGQTTEKELDEMISREKNSGIYLTCLGVGMGNYKDSKIEILAKKGNGNFAYLDTEEEGEKVLVKEFTQTLYAVADDVFINIKFNPDFVKRYRLIGFDNKRKALEDSTSMLEGGEIGSGHTMTAIFEIEPAQSSSLKSMNLVTNNPFATTKIHYKLPQKKESKYSNFITTYNFEPYQTIPQELKFASSVALFGSILKQSDFTPNAKWEDLIKMIEESIDGNNLVQKQFLDLVIKAQKLYSPPKKKKMIGF